MTTPSPSAFPTEEDSGFVGPEYLSEPVSTTNPETDSDKIEDFASPQESHAAQDASTGGVAGHNLVPGYNLHSSDRRPSDGGSSHVSESNPSQISPSPHHSLEVSEGVAEQATVSSEEHASPIAATENGPSTAIVTQSSTVSQDSLVAAEIKRVSLQQENQDLHTQLAEKKHSEAELRQANSELECEKEELEQQLQRMKQELQQVKNEKEALKQEYKAKVKEGKNEVDKLELILSESEKNKAALQQSEAEKGASLNEYKKNMEDKDSKIKELEEKIHDLQEKIKSESLIRTGKLDVSAAGNVHIEQHFHIENIHIHPYPSPSPSSEQPSNQLGGQNAAMLPDNPPIQLYQATSQPKSVSGPLNKRGIPRFRKQGGIQELVTPSSQPSSKRPGAETTDSEATDYESGKDQSVEAGNIICFKCFTRACNQCTCCKFSCCTVTTIVVVSVVVFVLISAMLYILNK